MPEVVIFKFEFCMRFVRFLIVIFKDAEFLPFGERMPRQTVCSQIYTTKRKITRLQVMRQRTFDEAEVFRQRGHARKKARTGEYGERIIHFWNLISRPEPLTRLITF